MTHLTRTDYDHMDHEGFYKVRNVDRMGDLGVIFLKNAAFTKTEEDPTDKLENGDTVYINEEEMWRCSKL